MTLMIHTIGHSNHPLADFIELLHQQRIVTVVDVRSQPYSKHAPHFSKTPLRQGLMDDEIGYVFLGRELGGRPGEHFHDKHGKVDYPRRATAPDFKAGVERLISIAGAAPTVILCSEEDPRRCHRRLLITPSLLEAGHRVAHIRRDGRVQPEEELLNASRQLALF